MTIALIVGALMAGGTFGLIGGCALSADKIARLERANRELKRMVDADTGTIIERLIAETL